MRLRERKVSGTISFLAFHLEDQIFDSENKQKKQQM